jgi:hypothetical protein
MKNEFEKVEEKLEAENKPILLVSEDDAYIADRMRSQPKTLDEVIAVKEKRYAPGEHRLSLPKELRLYEKEFSFRWINKRKRAIDEAIDVKGWIIVNRVLFPDLPKHLFASSGAIERGDALLAFMAFKKAEDIRKAPGIKSSEIVKNQLAKGSEPLPKGQSGFYKPEDTSSEKEDQGGLQEGRDF